MEHKYKATDFARALIRMDKYNFKKRIELQDTRSDRILLVLLDEMNLARVEYYFSDFLSKLELRQRVKNEEDAKERVDAEFVLETGTHSSDSNHETVDFGYGWEGISFL